MRSRRFGLILSGLIAVAFAVSCSSNRGGVEAKVRDSGLLTESDSLAYIVGMNIAEQMLKMDSTINVSVVCRAILEHSNGSSVMTRDEARDQYIRYLLYVEPERRRGYEEQFLADLALNNRDYTRTKSGLTYHIEVIGDESNIPKSAQDWVTIRYSISRVGGEKLYFESESDSVITVESALTDLLGGIEESVKLIGKGGRIKAWLPSKLAYGDDGDPQMGIEPIETLLYDIELIDLERNAASKHKADRVSL